jgi:hypothetical protein
MSVGNSRSKGECCAGVLCENKTMELCVAHKYIVCKHTVHSSVENKIYKLMINTTTTTNIAGTCTILATATTSTKAATTKEKAAIAQEKDAAF